MTKKATRTIVLTAIASLAVLMSAACASPSEPVTPPTTSMFIVDTTGSAAATDLLAAQQQRLAQAVAELPVGSRVVLRALDSDVTASCTDVVFTMPQQANPALEARVRDANRAEVAGRFADVVACAQTNARGRTELWGGIAEAVRAYPNATTITVASDGCENSVQSEICTPDRLTDPAALVAEIPPELAPRLATGATITYVGVGRGTGLDAGSVERLRQVVSMYTELMGATASFVTV